MRALLIDPKAKSITEVEIHKEQEVADIRRLIGGRSFEGVTSLNGSLAEGFDHLLCTAEADDSEQHFFQVDDPGILVPGNGLVTGVDTEGDTCDARISLADLEKRVIFSRRIIRGYQATKTDDGMRIDRIAPLVDGTDESAPVAGDTGEGRLALTPGLLLSAYNALTEPERICRLAAVVRAIGDASVVVKIYALHDHKGTLHVAWRYPPTLAERAAAGAAWEGQGEHSIEHYVTDEI